MASRLLVTGGAGFIGSNFVHYWLREHAGDRVVVLDALTHAGNLASLENALANASFRFVRGDVCDGQLVAQLLREEAIDTIVHFAAESHVDRSIVGPEAFIRTNVLGTHALLEAARTVWLTAPGVANHHFHHISTDEVYGSLASDDPPFSETTAYAPNSPYAASKAASDHLVRAYHHTYGLRTTISHCSNNYGPYHFPEKLIPLTIVNVLHGRPLPIYGDGRHVRDWLHVEDHCRGLDRILSRGQLGQVYNIGGGRESENIALVNQLCGIVDDMFAAEPALCEKYPQCPAARGAAAASLITFVRDRPGHDRRYAIDCSKIQRDLGYRAQVPLQTGLRDTLSWFVQNDRWWRQVMDGSYRQWITTQYEKR